MLNIIWLGMIFLSVIVGIWQGRMDAVVEAVMQSAKLGFELALGLTGLMSLWLGMMNIAKESGLVNFLAKMLRPLMCRLFPEVPPEDKAMGAMVMNIAANMLGLANAATPFGLQAMKELQRLNIHIHTASNSMCTFLVINTASIQLIPMTAIAYLSLNGSTHPSSIVISTLLTTILAMTVAIISVKQLSKWSVFKIKMSDNL